MKRKGEIEEIRKSYRDIQQELQKKPELEILEGIVNGKKSIENHISTKLTSWHKKREKRKLENFYSKLHEVIDKTDANPKNSELNEKLEKLLLNTINKFLPLTKKTRGKSDLTQKKKDNKLIDSFLVVTFLIIKQKEIESQKKETNCSASFFSGISNTSDASINIIS